MEGPLHTVPITHWGRSFTVSIWTGRYAHGGALVVELFDEDDQEPYATLSVNVAGAELQDNEFICKTYSENAGLLEHLLAAGVVEHTGRSSSIGPICRLLQPKES